MAADFKCVAQGECRVCGIAVCVMVRPMEDFFEDASETKRPGFWLALDDCTDLRARCGHRVLITEQNRWTGFVSELRLDHGELERIDQN